MMRMSERGREEIWADCSVAPGIMAFEVFTRDVEAEVREEAVSRGS